jgi:hypothetical protein
VNRLHVICQAKDKGQEPLMDACATELTVNLVHR